MARKHKQYTEAETDIFNHLSTGNSKLLLTDIKNLQDKQHELLNMLFQDIKYGCHKFNDYIGKDGELVAGHIVKMRKSEELIRAIYSAIDACLYLSSNSRIFNITQIAEEKIVNIANQIKQNNKTEYIGYLLDLLAILEQIKDTGVWEFEELNGETLPPITIRNYAHSLDMRDRLTNFYRVLTKLAENDEDGETVLNLSDDQLKQIGSLIEKG